MTAAVMTGHLQILAVVAATVAATTMAPLTGAMAAITAAAMPAVAVRQMAAMPVAAMVEAMAAANNRAGASVFLAALWHREGAGYAATTTR